MTFDQLRIAFPHFRYENRFILERIFNAALASSVSEDSMQLRQFLKCAGTLRCSSFEEKVKMLLDVIDSESKGYLTWKDLQHLCKQTFKMVVDIGQTEGLENHASLIVPETKTYVKADPKFDNEAFEEEMASYFADMIFERFQRPLSKLSTMYQTTHFDRKEDSPPGKSKFASK